MQRNYNEVERKRLENERQQLRHDYSETFKTAHGIRVLEDICEKAGIWNTSFTGNSKTYFNEGRRDLGLYVLKKANEADPRIINQFLVKNLSDKK